MTPLFATWLKAQDYADQTRGQTLQRVKALERLRSDGQPPDRLATHWRAHLLRILGGSDAGCPDLASELVAYAGDGLDALDARKSARGLRGGRKPKHRAREARSVSDEGWSRLLAALAEPRTDPAEEGAAAVLHVQAVTGLRIGDVLRIPRGGVAAAVHDGVIRLEQKGGKLRTIYLAGGADAWGRLAKVCEAPGVNVAQCMTGSSLDVTSSGAAYRRCTRLLDELEVTLQLDRMHTHRLRRTVGVQALRVGGDVAAVGELLGHAPGSKATMSYLDEARPERVAELADKVRQRFGGGA